MTDYVLVPGMNHGGWWYAPLVQELERLGHRAVAVTPTGLEDEPRTDRRIVLDTHVADVVAAIDALGAAPGEVVLVGHSYAGLLITGAADARPDAVRCLVYLDAFLPEDGDSSWSLTNDDEREWFVEDARRLGDAVDPLAFFDERARPHPVGTLLQSLRLDGAWRRVPRKLYVEATGWATPTPMRTSIDRAVADPEVEHVAWDTRHNVMHDGPGRVLDLVRDL
ncbi:alpha/beta fold hydrolase [Solicola sp. PLA-1-18]|uniref:alpha/beta fold hydrolase n=1 Tax=Solicola sp. PLA-1-18 TaxID=3380532 RepID=UPI003B7AC179